jgi:hypothetical protein
MFAAQTLCKLCDARRSDRVRENRKKQAVRLRRVIESTQRELLRHRDGQARSATHCIRKALDNLKRAGILAKPGGSYIVEDRLFAEYLATITDSAVPDPTPKSAGNRVVVEYHQKSREKK